MKRRIGCALVAVLGLGVLMSPFALITGRRVYRVRWGVDHAALVAACREIVANESVYKTVTSSSMPDRPRIDVTDKQLPDIVRRLQPTYLFVSGDVVEIEMGGGLGHYGLLVFTQGEATNNTARYPHRKMDRLDDGVWYYTL